MNAKKKLTDKTKQNEKEKNSREKVEERRRLVQMAFLKKLEEMPIIQVAASQIGIHRSTYYRWYDEDPVFRECADEAIEIGTNFINDMMESMLIKLAKEGKTTPIIFWLKNHHPGYMEMKRYEHFHRHKFEEEEHPLTDERKREIAECMYNWSLPDDGDEREDDYIVSEKE